MQTEMIKETIKASYGAIAKNEGAAGCCGSNTCCTVTEAGTSMKEDYSAVDGYQQSADLSLGCGIPTEIANINEGNTVVDLGSGAGNDAFIARKIVGETGRVIGIDMTPEMVIRALQNNQKLGFNNVEFVLGDIEDMKPIQSGVADVVISNCVMNLVPDKQKAFSEVHRVLKTGGHFSISDIVFKGIMPDAILEAAELYAGCISGASEKGAYLGIIKSTGFKNIQIKKERMITLPDELLLNSINKADLEEFKKSGSGIYSVTVYADKLDDGNCCDASGSGCCNSTASDVEHKEVKEACCTATADSVCC